MGLTRSLQTAWLTETVRLYEIKNGRCHDTQENRQAIERGPTLEARLAIRATALAEKLAFNTKANLIAAQARWALSGLLLMGLLGGISAAVSALGSGQHPVNLLVALLTLLGLHFVTLILWLISLSVETAGPPGLGKLWLAITRKLNKQADNHLLVQGLTSALSRAGALKPTLGVISHAIWTGLMAAAILTLLVLLSARQYQFQWETTLLGSGVFLHFTHLLGWVPSLLGFSTPDPSIIASSIGSPSPLSDAGVTWSSWLIGCVLVYGFFPRLILLLICMRWAQRNIRLTPVDTTLPGYINLHSTLMPESRVIGIDHPAAQPASQARPVTAATTFNTAEPYAILGLELTADTPWPPIPMGKTGNDLGRIDSREQRQHALQTLKAYGPGQVVAVCDASQTPDRGTLHFLNQLSTPGTKLYVVAQASQPDNNRERIWREQIANLPADSVHISSNLQTLFGATATPPHHAS
ncbi:MAG: hypothetical protein CML16_16045 [Pusillimonas sp.]|nr:hypothetical protein [Pusillimonas sp.]MBC41787.1 hypothetical protein [Pusillimonas sp.]|tara:strand:- start:10130 stop:11533 length:1404 start_codon:yes stop_codon:yes gene_type:complete